MSLIDRYLMRRFIGTFVFTLVALSMLFVIIDLIERLDNFIDLKIGIVDAISYYVYYLPYIAELLIPVASLLASLFNVGRLAASNEVTAMRAVGQSFRRFLAPYVTIALLISVGELYFNGWVVPQAISHKIRLERTVLQEGGANSLFNMYFRDTPLRNTTIEYYDETNQTARNVSIDEFTDVYKPRLAWRIEAPLMKWDSTARVWTADSALRRDIRGDTITITTLKDAVLPFTIRHEQIRQLQRDPDELTFDDLQDYIQTLKAGGKDTRRQEIDYYAQWAFPFANVIVILIAVPFASVRRRGGIAVNIAAAMVIAFCYIAFTEISQAVGVNMNISAELIGWSANIAFGVAAILSIAFTRR